jgi:hypothetical protein
MTRPYTSLLHHSVCIDQSGLEIKSQEKFLNLFWPTTNSRQKKKAMKKERSLNEPWPMLHMRRTCKSRAGEGAGCMAGEKEDVEAWWINCLLL